MVVNIPRPIPKNYQQYLELSKKTNTSIIRRYGVRACTCLPQELDQITKGIKLA